MSNIIEIKNGVVQLPKDILEAFGDAERIYYCIDEDGTVILSLTDEPDLVRRKKLMQQIYELSQDIPDEIYFKPAPEASDSDENK